MRVAVVGLWHLGCVTAACLSASGHDVIGVDTDEGTIAALRDGRAPLFEPGLDDLIAANLSTGRLAFSKDAAAIAGSEVVWITCDTPVDDDDRADVGSVVSRVVGLFPHLSDQTLVLISSQLPVGTTARFDELYAASGHAARVHFAYSPENLRLGKALNVFRQPDRVVVGLRHDADRARVSDLLAPITNRIEWMSIESAEMTKHALNAFLATSVAFANEIGALCEVTGADAKEVERGLKSESRIGSRAYLSPGAAFAGGTLARDLRFLAEQGATHHRPTLLLSAVRASNESHRHWAERRLLQELGDLRGQMIAVWGLTYKPGTDTLRRSSSVELCRALHGHGAMVRAHDPAVHVLPGDLAASIALAPTALDAVAGASALVVATEWPDYKLVNVDAVVRAMANPRVLDASRFLAASLGRDARVHYATVGAATSKMSSEVISGK